MEEKFTIINKDLPVVTIFCERDDVNGDIIRFVQEHDRKVHNVIFDKDALTKWTLD